MPTTHISFTHRDGQLPDASKLVRPDHAAVILEVTTLLEAMTGGHHIGSFTMRTDDGDAVAASGEVEFSGTSGTTTVTINGVAFSQASGTDAARCTAAVAAINASANALIDGVVTAVADDTTLTITADTKGKLGNTNTLAASGTGVTASGNRLTGGTDDTTAATVDF